jgi:hypothetical protein
MAKGLVSYFLSTPILQYSIAPALQSLYFQELLHPYNYHFMGHIFESI